MRGERRRLTVGIVIASDRCARGERRDGSGPAIRRIVEGQGWRVVREVIVADEQDRVTEALRRIADEDGASLILTSGGTGFGPRDVTPEATLAAVDRPAPGIPEMLRAQTARRNARAWLSRAVAGLRGRTLIVNLPGSPSAVAECLDVLLPLLPHACDMIEGHGHEHGAEAEGSVAAPAQRRR